jgi:hypothetical protein
MVYGAVTISLAIGGDHNIPAAVDRYILAALITAAIATSPRPVWRRIPTPSGIVEQPRPHLQLAATWTETLPPYTERADTVRLVQPAIYQSTNASEPGNSGADLAALGSRVAAVEAAIAELTRKANARADGDYVNGAMAALHAVNGLPTNVHRLR